MSEHMFVEASVRNDLQEVDRFLQPKCRVCSSHTRAGIPYARVCFDDPSQNLVPFDSSALSFSYVLVP